MRWLAVVLASVLAAGSLAACGESKPKVSEGGPIVAEAQIRSAYEKFFAGKTPVSERIGLLQNGAEFESVVKSFASNPAAKRVSATVSAMQLQGSGKAKVVYIVKLGGTALPKQTGTAVRENGTWKVGDASLCRLIALQGSTPSACKS
jgi:hypothetical protein